jgi:hypothetical protein
LARGLGKRYALLQIGEATKPLGSFPAPFLKVVQA